ncbi:MAG: Rha family transcriptional regulator [Burkholderiaceae bacterium]
MNFLTTTNQPITMSSREIAELTGKNHADVMRDIRRMLAELYPEGGVSKFADTHINPQNGQPYPIFNLPRRETLILVSGYSVTLRARVVDRWEPYGAPRVP